MKEFFMWFVHPGHAKMFILLLFVAVYSLILLYVYTGKKRSSRLESYKNIPFEEGDDMAPQSKENEHE